MQLKDCNQPSICVLSCFKYKPKYFHSKSYLSSLTQLYILPPYLTVPFNIHLYISPNSNAKQFYQPI